MRRPAWPRFRAGKRMENSWPRSPPRSGHVARLVLGVLFVIGVCGLMVTGRAQGPRSAAATLPTTTRSMSFAACQQTLRQTIRTMGVRPWDVVRLVDTDVITMTRVCTNDGSVLIMCSRPDEKMVVTKSPHQDGCPT